MIIPLNEKYRPKNFDEMILDKEIKDKFLEYIAHKNIPHLLFVGPPGTGKTSCAKILAYSITNDVMFINASEKRGIDTLRNEIMEFCTKVSFDSDMKIIILDEFDNITFDTMSALRGVMESFVDNARFILTGNFRNKILDAIISRCQVFEFQYPDKKEIFKRLIRILKEENIQYNKETVADDFRIIIQKYYPDIRAIIGFLEKNIYQNCFSLKVENLSLAFNHKDFLIKCIKEKNWKEIRFNICRKESIEVLYKYIFDNAEQISKEKCEIIMILAAEGLKEHSNVLDPEINFIATVLKIMREI